VSKPVGPPSAQGPTVVADTSVPPPAEAAAVQPATPAPAPVAAPTLSLVKSDDVPTADQKQKPEKPIREDSQHSSVKSNTVSPLPVPTPGDPIESPDPVTQDSGGVAGLVPVQQPLQKIDGRNPDDQSR